MADHRGFYITETLGTFGAKLKIAAFTKDRNQLLPENVEETKTIAKIRIHVEHVKGNIPNKCSIVRIF